MKKGINIKIKNSQQEKAGRSAKFTPILYCSVQMWNYVSRPTR